MGTRGPIGKRSGEKVRRNKTGEDGLETETITMVGKVEHPELALPVDMHPLVQDFWDSLPDSGQVKHWEPSDWQYCRLAMYVWNEMLLSPKGISAMKLSAVDAMLSKLLITEGDRRRVKLEVEREQAEAEVFDVAAYFKKQLAK